MRLLSTALAASIVLALPSPARAFCGFYVAPSDEPLENQASMVAFMRSGTRTVMSMSNDYKGPAKDFALVVPVPVVLKKEDVKTLDRAVFEKLEKLTAPRLVEYWEQDPCAKRDFDKVAGKAPSGAAGLSAGAGGGGGGGYGVTVEAAFAVGEYDVVVLGAKESDGLERWLVDNGYKIPKGASAALAPYIKEQQKFFVAKVDTTKIKMDAAGVAVLSPLRFSYESSDFRLPVRLGLLNAGPKQDLIVWILAENQRYEAANYPNAFVPTNLDVKDETRNSFTRFYAALFDETISRAGGKAIVTEYAWSSASCDPCPTPPLENADLVTLGADVVVGMVPAGTGAPLVHSGSVTIGTPKLSSGKNDDVASVIARNRWRFKACFNKALAMNPFEAGRLRAKVEIDADGAVTKASSIESKCAPPLTSCALAAFNAMRFAAAAATFEVDIDFVNGLVPTAPDAGAPTKGAGSASAGGAPMTPVPRVLARQPSMTITRLHTRYDASTLGDDIVFSAAKPVAGGREVFVGGVLEREPRDFPFNNFQARYAIRHAWEGSIACANPVRGVWGAKPGEARPDPAPATGLARAPRGDVKLASYVLAGLSWTGAHAEPGKPIAKNDPSKVEAPDTPTRKACRCSAPGAEASAWPALALLAITTLRSTRRRSRR